MADYGYPRISNPKQNIERQIRNIKNAYPDAILFPEIWTGTTSNRKQWQRLMNRVASGDRIIFDSVSRMSRNAEEGYKDYEELFKKGVSLVFLKEPHINTDVFQQALSRQIALTGTILDSVLKGINEYLLEVAKEQIRLAFLQAQKEVDDLHQRTKEGMETARRKGKKLGRPANRTYQTKKGKAAKKDILKLSRDFYGDYKDPDVIRLLGISRNSYYKYKRELREEQCLQVVAELEKQIPVVASERNAREV